jgi:pSer/pThr/pTyr-binding forkhead associated (FHA) protein
MRVILEMLSGPQKGKNFVFERPEAFVIGRKKNERVQFRIPRDRYLSRYHMLIEVNRAECLLRDLGSTNGTQVNDRRIKTSVLNDGDLLRAGKSEILVRIEAGSESEPEVDNGQAASDSPLDADWDTRVFGPGPKGPARKGLRCMICDEPAIDTHLNGLADTRLLAYVCPKCMKKNRDPEQPVPNYQKLDLLHRGELGPVYKARRTSTGKLVILKVLAPRLAEVAPAVRLFLRQMQLTAQLNHPRIVPVVEMGQAGSDLWVASEFIEGVDARTLTEQKGHRLPLDDAVAITLHVLEALDYAHGRNLVHRDVKPSNILVTGKPGVYEALLSDFGLAKNTDEAGVSSFTDKNEIRGTIPFMPPEQVLDCRFVKPAGDLYAAAASLYWMLTGAFVHDFKVRDRKGEVKDPYAIILEDPIIPLRDESRNPSVPEPVARVVETALAREPEQRPEFASELARALRKATSTKAATPV